MILNILKVDSWQESFPVVVLIEMTSHDWYALQKSQQWKELENILIIFKNNITTYTAKRR